MAVQTGSVNTPRKRPRVGLRLRVPREHWFFMGTDVPACRIQSRVFTDGETLKQTDVWATVDPQEQEGLIVFLRNHKVGSSEFPAYIVLMSVRDNVAMAREWRKPPRS